jgi:hypothetical protein
MAKTLKLWFSSREFGRVLSGTEEVTDRTLVNIKNKSGFNITRADIANFPNVLKTFSSYQNIIYRGVSKNDKLYLQVQSGLSQCITKRYYSCSYNRLYGERFSSVDKILLVIKSKRNFDVSKLSREREIILDKNVTLTVVKQTIEGGFTVIYLIDNDN